MNLNGTTCCPGHQKTSSRKALQRQAFKAFSGTEALHSRHTLKAYSGTEALRRRHINQGLFRHIQLGQALFSLLPTIERFCVFNEAMEGLTGFGGKG